METSAQPNHSKSHPAGEESSMGDHASLEKRDVMLLDFLREHDAPCPLCGYNLRALTRPMCPECKQQLTLTVGMQQPRLGWLLVAIVPGVFSGFAAILLAIPIIMSTLESGVLPPWFLLATDAFGFTSGFFAIGIALRRYRFLAMPMVTQRGWAIVIWTIHILWLLYLVLLGFTFN